MFWNMKTYLWNNYVGENDNNVNNNDKEYVYQIEPTWSENKCEQEYWYSQGF